MKLGHFRAATDNNLWHDLGQNLSNRFTNQTVRFKSLGFDLLGRLSHKLCKNCWFICCFGLNRPTLFLFQKTLSGHFIEPINFYPFRDYFVCHSEFINFSDYFRKIFILKKILENSLLIIVDYYCSQ